MPHTIQHHLEMQNSNHFLQEGHQNATNKWAMNLLKECAKAIFEEDSVKIHHILWMLNELASPYGDCEQKVAFYFLQALFYKLTESGKRSYKTLVSASEKLHSFDSARKVILKFQEVSPWTTFGHVASNNAILEAFEGKSQLHIIDISNNYCTQWPTLLESLATRNDDTPHLKLSVVVTDGAKGSVMEEIGYRMQKFARLMGVSFEFKAISTFSRLSDFDADKFGVNEDEAVAVNCIGAFQRLKVEERAEFIHMIQSLQPRVLTVVEEEADFSSNKDEFFECFEECFKFYSMFFEMLEESFSSTCNERLMLERECSRSILKLLACGEDEGESERREKGIQWCNRLLEAFSPASFSEDAIDDVKALLKRYQEGWSLLPASCDASGLYMTWKQKPVVWASAWKL